MWEIKTSTLTNGWGGGSLMLANYVTKHNPEHCHQTTRPIYLNTHLVHDEMEKNNSHVTCKGGTKQVGLQILR